MKIRHTMISLVLVMAAGCDTMDQDSDGQVLSINSDPAYFLPGNDGIIDLAARIVSPGKVKVEITGTTQNGALLDLGKGLLRYSPSKGSKKDFFGFRVLSSDNKVLGEDTIDIIIPSDTTTLPCAVYTRNDSVTNVTSPVTVDVAANDWACFAALTITVDVGPEHGTATIVGNKVLYTPGVSYAGRDQLLYKATTSSHTGYGMLWILGADSVSNQNPNCNPVAKNDLFFKPLNDTTLMFLNVLANDSLCNDSSIFITKHPSFGTAFISNRKIGYRNGPNLNFDDTIFYKVGGSNAARAIIKRQ